MDKKLSMTLSMTMAAQRARWLDLFSADQINCSPRDVRVPKRQSGLNRIIIVPHGLTVRKLLSLMRRRFAVVLLSSGGDDDESPENPKTESIVLEDRLLRSVRTSSCSSYAIRTRDCLEADISLEDIPKGDVANQHSGMTLLERLLFGYMHYSETGTHLDQNSVTLCSGSRYDGFQIPCVYWDPVLAGGAVVVALHDIDLDFKEPNYQGREIGL